MRCRAGAWMAILALAMFGAGLALPAGVMADGGGAVRSLTGAELLGQVATVAFPLSMFGVMAMPVALWAALGRSRSARLSAGAAFLLAAMAGPLFCATAWVTGSAVAWAGAGVAMAGSARGIGARRT